MRAKISKRSGIKFIPFDKQKALSLEDIGKLQRDFKDLELYVVKAHELLDNKKDEDGRYDLDDLLISIEKLQEKEAAASATATILSEALEIAIHGLNRLSDVSDDFVYARAFYCCEFAAGIVNRVSETLNKIQKEANNNASS